MADPIPLTKQCSQCRKTKPLDQFHCQRKSRDRKQCNCKDCQRELSRQWYRNNAAYVSMRRSFGIRTRNTPVPCDQDFCG